MNKKKEKQSLHPFIILVGILLITFVIAVFLPAGEYERIVLEDGRTVVDADTYHAVEGSGFNLHSLLTSIPRGIQQAANVVVITLMIGGAFGVIKKTGMLDIGVEALVSRFAEKKTAIIFILFFVFAIITGFIGVPELSLVYIPVLMPLLFRLGYDSIVAIAISLCSTAAGFSAAWSAPATVGLGHQLSDLPLYSGMNLRVLTVALLALSGAIYTARYAKKILKNPELSPVYEEDKLAKARLEKEHASHTSDKYPRVKEAGIVTIILFFGLILGVVIKSWGFDEMSGYFIIMGVLPGLIAGMTLNEVLYAFQDGIVEMLVGALICGIARGISVVLMDARVMDTIIMYLAQIVTVLPKQIASIGMYIITTLFNGVIASGSGKAVISLPIMIPLADLSELSRQTTILAYQLGDGISNIIWPASGYFMAALAIGKLDYKKWIKWYMPLFIIWSLIACVILYIASVTGYGPF